MKFFSAVWLTAMTLCWCQAGAQSQPVAIHFRAMIGGRDFTCGESYSGVGLTNAVVSPRDLRFYVHKLRLIDADGNEVPIHLSQDERWQLDDLALLDFEDGTGSCDNGTPERNTIVTGMVRSAQRLRGLRFVVGVPAPKNHIDPSFMPPPLDLTSMFWSWNDGRKFLRIELANAGHTRGYAFHLGSTGCHPDAAGGRAACVHPNLVSIALPDFEPISSEVVVDIGALLAGVDLNNSDGCLSTTGDAACAPLFRALGLDLPSSSHQPQTVFLAKRRTRP